LAVRKLEEYKNTLQGFCRSSTLVLTICRSKNHALHAL